MSQINFYRMRRIMWVIERLDRRIARERMGAVRTTSCISRLPKDRRNFSQVEESVVEIVDLENTRMKIARKLMDFQNDLDPYIDYLDNPEDKMVLRLRYIEGFPPVSIAYELQRPCRFIYYILERAENELARKFPDAIQVK